MTHLFIDQKISLSKEIPVQLLMHPEYNLDNLDTISSLPTEPGVVAICGRVNGRVANCRMIRAVPNVQSAVRQMYEDSEQDLGFRNYMRSIKTKMLVYKTFTSFSNEMEQLRVKWSELLAPACTEEMNQVF